MMVEAVAGRSASALVINQAASIQGGPRMYCIVFYGVYSMDCF